MDDDVKFYQEEQQPNLPQGTHLTNTDALINDFFYEIETGGGGNCLFYSLSYLLSGTPINHGLVRAQICTHVLPEHARSFVVEDERAAMCLDGTWGTDLEIQIAAVISGRPIIVYKRHHQTGISDLCWSSPVINRIISGEVFTGVRKYLVDQPYSTIRNRIYCIYLPDTDTPDEPLILYNLNQTHYRALKPKYSTVSYSMRIKRKKSLRTKRKSLRTKRKSLRTKRKSMRKSKKKSVRTKRKSKRKSVRTKRKSVRKSKKKSVRTKRKSKRKSKK